MTKRKRRRRKGRRKEEEEPGEEKVVRVGLKYPTTACESALEGGGRKGREAPPFAAAGRP